MSKTYTVYGAKCDGCTALLIFFGGKHLWKRFMKSKKVKDLMHANCIIKTVVKN